MENWKEKDGEITTGLWVNFDKNNNPYLNGSIMIDGVDYWVKVFVVDPERKKSPSSPDRRMLLTRKDASSKGKPRATAIEPEPQDDNIPF